ncbi:MAG: type I pullulanase [Vagococcus sp.]|uniref:type I pullulanase n=1 Tax=Vagococcus TaxID=2737 RepID=UPI002FCC39F4
MNDVIYLGKDLGVSFTPEKTVFKVWSPEALSAKVNIYTIGNIKENTLLKSIDMTLVENVWSIELAENLDGLFYTFVLEHEKSVYTETNDIYAKAVGINGNRGAIIDFSETNPTNWNLDKPVAQKSITDAYIWEVHVADFSSDVASGVSEKNRGKYLAFTETETTLNNGGVHATGVNYLKDLGVNYVHLLPSYDTNNDELGTAYNWGYDPKNYNVPEGRYSSNPHEPKVRIKEFKQMVQSLHESNIGVVLDVVYNHTAITENSWFNLTYPKYYYRQDEKGNFADGSACGNEVASDRLMVRQFIADSVLYWAQEYHLDGFRFDLMGLHDVATMNLVRQQLNENGLEHVILYGEPWDAGSNEIKFPNLPANKSNTDQFDDGIAVFNDDFRDAVKGYVFEEKEGGFVQGCISEKADGLHPYTDSADLKAGLTANTRRDLAAETTYAKKDWARTPKQSISYVSAHDNLSLWDKLVLSTKEVTGEESYQKDDKIIAMNQLAATLLFTSQGGIFTQAGEEFARTKFGDENSFVSPIEINQLNWHQIVEFQELVAYYKGLWEIRKAYQPLRDGSNQTANATCFADMRDNVIMYSIPNLLMNKGYQKMVVIVNASQKTEEINLHEYDDKVTEWGCLADKESASATPKYKVSANKLVVEPCSSMILVY